MTTFIFATNSDPTSKIVVAIQVKSIMILARQQLPLKHKASLLGWLVFIAPVQAAISITYCVVLAHLRHLPLRFYVTCGVLRVALDKLTGVELQYLLPSSIECYRKWVKGTPAVDNLEERIDILPDKSSSILWLGDPAQAEKVVLFFHGGGYKAPLLPGHLEWCRQAYFKANPNVKVAVALLQYSLTPEAAYPVQLSQASNALRYLFQSGFTPRDIVIGGDSAGGNLTAQLLGHLLHQHPRVEALQMDNEAFLGVFLVSPFLSTLTETGSFKQNDGIDMLSTRAVSLAVTDVSNTLSPEMERQEERNWATPLDAGESWFDGLSRICSHLYVTVGQQEMLRDQGVLFAELMRRRNPDMNIRLEIAKDEAHDFILLEGEKKVVGDATTRMKAWYNALLT